MENFVFHFRASADNQNTTWSGHGVARPAENLPKIAWESNLFAKKVTAKEIFGSNLVLANREARLTAPSGEDLSGGNAWAALCAANKKVGVVAESQILVQNT